MRLPIRTEFAKLGGIYTGEEVDGGAEEVIQPIAVEDGDAAVALFEGFAHVFRKEVVTVVFLWVFVEQAVVKVDEFHSICRGDLAEIADDPADLLEVPVVGEPDEAVVRGDIGGEGELAATESAEVALAVFRTPASHQVHVAGRFRLHFGHIDGVRGALIAAQAVPKLSVGLKVGPFFFEGDGYCHADITAEGFAGGVVRCA